MKITRRFVSLLLSLFLLSTLIVVTSASQSGAAPAAEQPAETRGMHTPEEYRAITTEEQAAQLSVKQNAGIDYAMYVNELAGEKLQAYMSTHEVTTDAEVNEIINRIYEEAQQEAMQSGLFPQEMFEADPISPEDIPAVPEGLEGEELRQAQAQQKKVYTAYLDQEETNRRRENFIDITDESMNIFRTQVSNLIEQNCEISGDGRTITFSITGEPADSFSAVMPILTELAKNETKLNTVLILPGSAAGQQEAAPAEAPQE
jgi:hypothetical protein